MPLANKLAKMQRRGAGPSSQFMGQMPQLTGGIGTMPLPQGPQTINRMPTSPIPSMNRMPTTPSNPSINQMPVGPGISRMPTLTPNPTEMGKMPLVPGINTMPTSPTMSFGQQPALTGSIGKMPKKRLAGPSFSI